MRACSKNVRGGSCVEKHMTWLQTEYSSTRVPRVLELDRLNNVKLANQLYCLNRRYIQVFNGKKGEPTVMRCFLPGHTFDGACLGVGAAPQPI